MHVRAPRISARSLLALIGELDASDVVYETIAARIRLLIVDGRIPVGTTLPSERDLATQSGRSRTTVVAAYQSLRDTGHLVSRQGSGSRAALPSLADISKRPGRVVNFAGSVPPPAEGLRELINEVTRSLPDITQLPGFDLLGHDRLREAIADRYCARGLPTAPDQIVVTTGGQAAIALTAQTLLGPSNVALVESPTYPHAYEAIQRTGARVISTPVTATGWDIDHFEQTLLRARPSLAYIIPDFHNPTGASLPAVDRARIARAARAAGTTLVVDEATADLDIDRHWQDGPFARHAAQIDSRAGSGIITLGSLSKSVWSGLRIGWIRADKALVHRLVQARPAGDLGTPPVEQIIAERVVRNMDLFIQSRRRFLRDQRAALHSALQRHLPGWNLPWPDGGLALWVELDEPRSSALAARARTMGIDLVAGPKFSIDGALERFLRLPFSSSIADLDLGVQLIAATWHQVRSNRSPLECRETIAPR